MKSFRKFDHFGLMKHFGRKTAASASRKTLPSMAGQVKQKIMKNLIFVS